MAKVYIGVGHGGSDPGAVKYLVEKDVNLKMALACRDYLVTNGVSVLMSRQGDEYDSITAKTNEANAWGADLAIDVHNNAGGGDGFEVLCSVIGGVSRTLAENIEAEVKNIGQNSRGIKMRKGSGGKDYYGFIRQTKMPAVICEGVFVDNIADASQADTDAECKAFGVAYAKGILKTLGVIPSNEPTPANNIGYKVRITASELNVRAGAGTNYNINTCVKRDEVYTIVDEKYNGATKWGKLKSGAGWISLKYTQRI